MVKSTSRSGSKEFNMMVEAAGSGRMLDDEMDSTAVQLGDDMIEERIPEVAAILDSMDKEESFHAREIAAEMEPPDLTIKSIAGVGPSIAKKLEESGFSNLRALATLSPKMLQEQSGIGDKTAQKIVQAAQELCKIDFTTADVVFEKRQQLGRITTGCNALDELFGGGIETGAVTELSGEYRTGKTQIAHQACLNVQLPTDKGGLAGKALYVDTEGTFRPERIAQMAIARGHDVKTALKNIIYARAYNSEHQVTILKQARKLVEGQDVKLIVIDSIIAHFRSEYMGLGSLGPRQQLLNMHLHQVLQLVDTYSIAAIVTNQVQAKPDVFFGNPTIPAGGNILAHGSTYRVFLRKGKGETRVAKMIDAPGLPESEAVFKISEKGIENAEE